MSSMPLALVTSSMFAFIYFEMGGNANDLPYDGRDDEQKQRESNALFERLVWGTAF